MASFLKEFLSAINKPDPRPYLFKVGSTVRVLSLVLEDGQTPKFWAGAICVVESRRATMMLKEHWYRIKHPNGAVDVFNEDELDARYQKGKAEIAAQAGGGGR